MNSPIQEIKERLDIVEFIRSHITLLPAGKNFKGLCPFHKEKTPSFMVSPERHTWHCFGACSEGGDIFKFLMKYENLEFYEALKVLAERAGIELKKISPAEQKQFGILYDIGEVAKNFFKKKLEESASVLKYAKERGLKKETIDEFELGFASPDFDELTRYLINIGFDIRDVERSGLTLKSEKGRYLDRFRGRLMFPIYNSFGKVVAFSGRILPEHESATERAGVGKYINSPETPIFNKSRVLYGLHKTKNNIKEENQAVLVEGQMDFLMLYQDGILNAAATSGTALTQDHLKTLHRLTGQLILCFDNDEAGFKAAERSIDLAGANDFDVRLLTLRDYKDPAEAVRKKPGLMSELLKDSRPAMEFYFNRYLTETDQPGSVSNLKKNLRIILGKIKNLASSIEKAHWLKELSLKTGINEKSLLEEMEQLELSREKLARSNEQNKFNIQSSSGRNSISRRELIAERLFSLLVARENLRTKINEHLEYLPDDYVTIFESLSNNNQVIEERLVNLLNLISLRSSFELEILGEDKINGEFETLLKQIQLEYLKEKRQKLLESIKDVESKGDEPQTLRVLKEFDEISRIMENIR